MFDFARKVRITLNRKHKEVKDLQSQSDRLCEVLKTCKGFPALTSLYATRLLETNIRLKIAAREYSSFVVVYQSYVSGLQGTDKLIFLLGEISALQEE